MKTFQWNKLNVNAFWVEYIFNIWIHCKYYIWQWTEIEIVSEVLHRSFAFDTHINGNGNEIIANSIPINLRDFAANLWEKYGKVIGD